MSKSSDEQEAMLVASPLYLLIADQACNLCGQSNPVAAIATVNLDIPEEPQFKEFNKGEGFLLSYVGSLPDELMAQVLERHPNFQIDYSAMDGKEYFMSICQSCGGRYGDHYVHRQIRDQAFRSPKTLRVERLPFEGTFQSDAGISSSSSVAELFQSVEEGFMPPLLSDPIVEEGAAAYTRSGGRVNKNPYPVYSDEFNRFEMGWSRALKSGGPMQRSNDDEGKTYRLDMSKFGKSD